MRDDFKIPRFLDHPTLFPIWTKGETLCVSIPMLLLWFIFKDAKGVLLGAMLGVTLFKYFRGFKSKNGEHVLPRLCYWYFPKEISMVKMFPPSHIREYVG